jgi:alpha-L-rhamnosidase
MKTRVAIFLLALSVSCCSLWAQDYYADYRADWLEKAEMSKPNMIETVKSPLRLVDVVQDESAFQGWKTVEKSSVDLLYQTSFKSMNQVIVDFGEHLTGYFDFTLSVLKSTPDAPLRFKLTFAEVPAELATPFDPYPGGLSRAWLQDEVVTVMTIPETVRLERRMAFRYVKIELLGSSSGFDFAISNMRCVAVTSAANLPAKLAENTPQVFRDIDRISLNTLKECMQTVYEDGPKRDRRLWLGDLYLEALANNFSFKQYDLTKRCLYLLAALAEEDGFFNVTVFEEPEPHPQKRQLLLDYSLLYSACLKDYLLATGDRQTAEDLWPAAVKQLDIIHRYLQKSGLMDFERAAKEWWIFFDWKDGLHKEVALQGVSIFALRETYALAQLLDREKEVADYPAIIRKMTKASRTHYYHKQTGVFTGLLNKQVSFASQIWMVLAEVPSQAEGQKALLALETMPDVCIPGGPYLYHYYIEALLKSGLKEVAREKVANYWGKMVEKGADTFWEVYDPNNEFTSPYRFYPINSYCHAWSCTPTYFIRKYPEIFQK